MGLKSNLDQTFYMRCVTEIEDLILEDQKGFIKGCEAFEMWIWRKVERVKLADKIKNAVVLERVGPDKEEEKKLAGPLAKKELSAEGCSRRNGKWEEGSSEEDIK